MRNVNPILVVLLAVLAWGAAQPLLASYSPSPTAVLDGGTGATTASGARTNLGLAIGTDVEAHTAALSAVSGTNTGDQTDATLPFSDITTNDASTSSHGFLKKLDNDPTHFMDGQGNWSAPSASRITGWNISAVSGSDATTTSLTAVNITGLTYACAASTLYEFEGVLVAGSSSAAGCKYAVQYSAAGATTGAVFSGAVTTTTGAVTSVNALNSLDATAFFTGSQKSFVWVRGWLQTGANTGNLTLQQAKVTSGTATVYIGSMLKVRVAGT